MNRSKLECRATTVLRLLVSVTIATLACSTMSFAGETKDDRNLLTTYTPSNGSYTLHHVGTVPGAVAEMGGFAMHSASMAFAACADAVDTGVHHTPFGRKNPYAGSLSIFSLADIVNANPQPTPIISANLGRYGNQTGGVATDGTNYYQVVYDTGVIVKNGPNGQVAAVLKIPTAGLNGGLDYHNGTLWLHAVTAGVIVQLDANTGAVLHSIPADPSINGLAWLNNRFFVTINGQGVQPPVPGNPAVAELDPNTGAMLGYWPMPAGYLPHALTSDGANLYMMVQVGSSMWTKFQVYSFTLN